MHKLLVLQSLAGGLPQGTDTSNDRGFERLPFAVLPQQMNTPHDSRIVAEFPSFPDGQLDLLRGIDWLLTQSIDVLSLSLAPVGPGPFHENHPLQLASRFADELGIPVIVAAGNRGPTSDTLQPMARMPWVIAVGAADARQRLVASSSRGDPHGLKPTVVADGSLREYDPKYPLPATSFATPKVAQIVALIGKCLELVLGDLTDVHEETWCPIRAPIRLPIVGTADTGVSIEKLPPRAPTVGGSFLDAGSDLVKVSRSDRERDWLKAMLETVHAHGAYFEANARSGTIKRALELMARPLTNHAPFEVGAGYVSPDQAAAFFRELTPSRLINWLCPELLSQLSGNVLAALDQRHGSLWEAKQYAALVQLFVGGIRIATVKVVH